MLFKKLIRTAWQYKSQFISMVIMISIGVGIFLGFNIEWKSIEEDTNSFFEKTNYADYRLYSENGFSRDDIEKISGINGIEAACRYLNVNVTLKNEKKTLALNVSEDYNVSTMMVIEGEKYDELSEGIWLSDRFAKKNKIAIGDKITTIYKGIEIEGKVVGLIKSGEMMICVADENQLMPDFETFGFAYISPKKLKNALDTDFYPQINIISKLGKDKLEKAVRKALGRTILVSSKSEHMSYAGAKSEAEEGKTMGLILPVLFLAIAVLTMITTMHRIASNEKVQIGTLKALGFRDKDVLWHYTSYGFVIGLIGTVLGVALGYGIAALIMSPNGMMSTYFDLPEWKLVMPWFCIPVIILMILVLTVISYWSVKEMLKGTAAEALRPYIPKIIKKSFAEKMIFWKKISFGAKWNIRDIMRHKTRSAMTLAGVVGCMLLLVGGLGMKDTMSAFMNVLNNEVSNYKTKINITETADYESVNKLVKDVSGDWVATSGISYNGNTITLEVYNVSHDKIRFVDKKSDLFELKNDGIYLCLRLADSAKVGDYIEISPYGSKKTYKVRVAGYFRSMITESIVMTETYAKKIGMPHKISAVFTDVLSEEIDKTSVISNIQDKKAIMDTYDSFMDIMNAMVLIFVLAAIILGIVVLYNLGVMSYIERSRELATLKVLGFRDKNIGRLLIGQNIWLTIVGVILGLPAGVGVLYILIVSLASEYELSLSLGVLTYSVSVLLTFGVSVLVGIMVAGKNKKIDMVEALLA